MAHLALSLLGACEATLDGQLLTGFRTPKARALLVYLAVHAERAHGREALASLLWPEQPDETARTYLRQALAYLRAILDEEAPVVPVLLITRDTVQLNPACALDLDVAIFRALLAECACHAHRRAVSCTSCARRREQAVALYRGSFLEQFYLRESASFDEWVTVTREALHQEAVIALAQLATYHERRGTYDAVERLARRQLALDPWREEAHQQLMRALALSGQRSAALEQYERCRAILQADLSVEPSTETEALYRQICAEQIAPEVAPARAVGLPHPTTSFVGREADRAALVEQLTTRSCRLVTLVGAPGIGKTRLSLEVAAELVGDFEDGVVFVPLAALSDPALVVTTIAAALQVKELGEEPVLETLKRAMRTRHLLLVLDNFEQVLDAAEPIAELLAAAPDLVVLVTSRAVLRLAGEQEYPVPALGLPDLLRLPAVTVLMQCEAVALFAERARASRPDFQLTRTNASAVAEICARLDGLPLAIELAAARVKLLSPEALLQRLAQSVAGRLGLLTGGARDLPHRQQTLRNTIAWSYGLLDTTEQMLFRRLGVFVDGWTLAAAEAVCDGVGDLRLDVLNGLQSLLDKSLVRQVEGTDGDPRYMILETIREYALERLAASGEIAVVQRRHAAYCLALAEEAEPWLMSGGRGAWLRRLEVEHDNLRAALDWSRHAADRAEVAARLAGALAWFWYSANYWHEGRDRFEEVLRQLGPNGVSRVPRTATWAGVLFGLVLLSDGMLYDAGLRLLIEESVAIFREVDDQRHLVPALVVLGLVEDETDDDTAARAHFDESIALARIRDDRRSLTLSLGRAGRMEDAHGNHERAGKHYAEGLTLARQEDDAWLIAFHQEGLADVALAGGRAAEAVRLYGESHTRYQTLENTNGVRFSLFGLARAAAALGHVEQAEDLFVQSLRLFRDPPNLWHFAEIIGELAGLAAMAEAQPAGARRAVRLYGAVEAVLKAHPHPTLALLSARPDYDRTVATTRAWLDAATWATAWAEGQAMTLDQAIAYALDEPGA